MQVEKEGVMFGSTNEGLIFALEGKTGKVLWKHKIGNSPVSYTHLDVYKRQDYRSPESDIAQS